MQREKGQLTELTLYVTIIHHFYGSFVFESNCSQLRVSTLVTSEVHQLLTITIAVCQTGQVCRELNSLVMNYNSCFLDKFLIT